MPLSNSTYGKASAMTASTTDLADRITAVLENAHPALDTLDQSNRTGAVADQGAVNMLRKVIQDMGTIALDVRRAAMEESQQDESQASADASRDATTGPGTSGAAAAGQDPAQTGQSAQTGQTGTSAKDGGKTSGSTTAKS